MINSKTTVNLMRQTPDLYSFSAGNLPSREASAGSLPPIVEELFWDVDGVYAEDVQRAGLCNHPQVVAATAAELSEYYVVRLLESDPVVGCAVLYGALTIRGTSYFLKALESATERILYPESLSTKELQLIVHTVKTAIASRNLLELEGNPVPKPLNHFSEIRERLVAARGFKEQEKIEEHFPTFSRYREIIDEIKRSVVAGRVPSGDFYGSVEPTMENYLKAVFGVLSKAHSPTQQAALEFFTKLDEPLLNKFKFGLQHSYLSNEGPSRPRPRE